MLPNKSWKIIGHGKGWNYACQLCHNWMAIIALLKPQYASHVIFFISNFVSGIWHFIMSVNIFIWLTSTFITYSLYSLCHFQFGFKLIMIFWPNELFFDFLVSSDLDNFDCLVSLFCILFLERDRFPKYTLMTASFLFSIVSILIIISVHEPLALVALHVHWDFSFTFMHEREYAVGIWDSGSFQTSI